MTENDVTRLLGGPPRFTDPVGFDAQWADDYDSVTVQVNWDASGGVIKKSYWGPWLSWRIATMAPGSRHKLTSELS
jgi:hypothetical protein